MMFFTNQAAAVREKAAEEAEEMAAHFGADWVIKNFKPKVYANLNQNEQVPQNFRISALKGLARVMKVLNAEQIGTEVIPTILESIDGPGNLSICAIRIVRIYVLFEYNATSIRKG